MGDGLEFEAMIDDVGLLKSNGSWKAVISRTTYSLSIAHNSFANRGNCVLDLETGPLTLFMNGKGGVTWCDSSRAYGLATAKTLALRLLLHDDS